MMFILYLKHIYELCWEILQGIYLKEPDAQAGWYEPRPEDDVIKFKSLRDVQVKSVTTSCGGHAFSYKPPVQRYLF